MHLVTQPILKPEGTKVRYTIQTEQSTFTVRAFATGLLAAFGHSPAIAIPDFEGEIHIGEEIAEQSSLHLVVHSASLKVIDDIREKDRLEIDRIMHKEVLESDSFPEILYDCSRLSASKTGDGTYWLALNGYLTLHGVTRMQPVSARVDLNGDALRAGGECSIRQSDYEIQPVSAVGGTIKVKDELKFRFDISARRQTG